MLPMPAATRAAESFPGDTPEVKQNSLGLIHRSGFYKALAMPTDHTALQKHFGLEKPYHFQTQCSL
jgi:hypothetical protein